MPVLAAVDIGSNSVRLKIAKLTRGKLETIHEDREVTRLGEGVFREGSLSPESIALTVKTLERFKKACERHRVDQVRVVATSATRDARNAREFASWVKRATGWNMDVISGLEEGRLIHLGVMANSRFSAQRILFFDLGGGSCEITLTDQGHILQVFSIPLGAVRLTQEFVRHDPPTAPDLRRMHDYVREELVRVAGQVREARPELTIATSGTAAAISAAAHAFNPGKKAQFTTRDAAFDLLDELSLRTVKERAEIPGINAKRAEIIVAGSMVFAELLRAYDLPGFRYSPLGLRDGILAQMAADADGGTRELRRIEAEREDAIAAMCKRYLVDIRHATQVRQIASQLFKELQRLHKVPADYLPYLEAAAMLHEVGYFVNRHGRHRHTWYLIVHSEIFGFDEFERMMIAGIARYMGKSVPQDNDYALRMMPDEAKQHVPKLVSLLRLARALNQSRTSAVRQVHATARPKQVMLTLERKPKANAELELWAAEKEQHFFKHVFGRALALSKSK